MGFFSWLAADSGISISSRYSSRGAKPVYLLQPNGAKPVAEPSYEGYGIFGDVDAYVWLAQHNLPAETLAAYPVDANRGVSQRSLGVTLGVGDYHVDTQTGRKYCFFNEDASIIDPEITFLPGNYSAPQEAFDGLSANDLISSKRFVEKSFEVKTPLKFSYDPNAVYENLKPSPVCPDQGMLYDHGDDYDDDLEDAA